MEKNKRGQITVFIVVGIIILFAVGLLLYVASITPGLRLFAPQESEIDIYIGSCLESTAEEAVVLAGNTGGYINVPSTISANERSYFSFGVRTEPKIPLWYYRGNFRIPDKDFIANEISNYIFENIDSCIGTFDILKDRFEFKKTGNTTLKATIGQNDVSIELNYPLEAKDRLSGATINTVPISRNVDVKLGRMHDMAVDILRTETKKLFFENLTINILSTSNQFPLTNMDFSCSPKTWRKSQIIDFAKNALYYNLQQVTVRGNRFTFYNQNDAFSRSNYVFELSKQYSDIGALFFYPKTSRFEMHVRPNDREFLRSNVGRPLGGSGPFSAIPFCINTYHFTYDIEYPLLTTLNDPTAFSGRGFTFNFAFPVTINHNQGDKADFPLTLFEAPEFNYDFCTTTAGSEVYIKVKDYLTYEEIYQAPVEFRCIRYVCDYGKTKSEGGEYRVRAKLPSACTGGTLSSNPEGFIGGSVVYEGQDSVDILVKPLKTFRLKFLKHDSNSDRVTELEDVDFVTMYVRSTSDPSLEQYYISNTTPNEIQLINGPGDYYIETYLLQGGEQFIGGYIGDWNLSYSELAGKNELTMNLLQIIPIPVTEEEQANALDYLQSNQEYRQRLRPVFS